MDGRARSVCTEQMLMILPDPRDELVPRDLATDEKRTGQIDPQYPVPVVQAHLEQRLSVLQPGIVHQHLVTAVCETPAD